MPRLTKAIAAKRSLLKFPPSLPGTVLSIVETYKNYIVNFRRLTFTFPHRRLCLR